MKAAELAEIYDRHGDQLIRFAATQVGPAHAEDVLATAMVSILASESRNVADMKNYLYRSVANAGRKHWRTLDRRTRREALDAQPGSVEDSYRDPEVIAALSKLSPQQRAIIHLTYWEDLTVPVVAKRLGVSDWTIRKQLARARKALKGPLS